MKTIQEGLVKAEIAQLKRELDEEREWRIAACRAHAILSKSIKKALQLENWPDFHKMYGSGLFAEGVARLLNEEVDKLRLNCTKVRHEKRKSKSR